jgi:fructose-1,6-bisphosphatase/inositol monophosphatase family enzyme
VTADPLALLADTADAVGRALARVSDRGFTGRRAGQYVLDVDADDAALDVLRRAGVGVLSEESGFERGDRSDVVIIDPVDGSTNASRGLPWYATAMCLVDADGPAAAMVVNQATGERWWCERGGGAWGPSGRLAPSACVEVSRSIVALNGLPPHPLGYWQSRVYGAVALDLCMVAAGVFDGYVDCVVEAHGVWDHAASTMICREAGATIEDVHGRDLIPLDVDARRTPIAAATPALFADLLRARRGLSG